MGPSGASLNEVQSDGDTDDDAAAAAAVVARMRMNPVCWSAYIKALSFVFLSACVCYIKTL